MSTQIQWRRGTTAQHSVFTGALGEVTVDTDKDTLVVHDNSTVGGFPLARESALNTHTARTDNPHGVTKAQVGLGNADNTADANKVVASAGKLTTGRTISLSGDATGSVSFDGSANVDVVVTVGNATHTHAFGNLTGKPTTLSGYGITDADTSAKVTTKINNAVAALVDASPAALDTLNELAAALGDDPNFATTTSTALGNRVVKNADIVAGTGTKVTYDSKGLVTGGSTPTTLAGYSIADAYTKTEIDNTKVTKITSTDNAVVRFDGTTGDVQNSGVIIDDSNNVGIGLNNPHSKLSVQHSASGNTGANSNTAGSSISIDASGSIDPILALRWTYNRTGIAGKLYTSQIVADSANNNALEMYTTGTTPLAFGTNSTERMRIDANGNVGIGVTPSAWHTTMRAIDIGTVADSGTLYSSIGVNHSHVAVGANYYYDYSFNTRYKGSYPSSMYQQSVGSHEWKTAPSGTAGNPITWNTAMTLSSSGNLLVGTTTDNGVDKLQVNGSISVSNNSIIGNVKHCVWSYNETGSYSTSAVHFKTNLKPTVHDKMFCLEVKGYNYGTAESFNAVVSGYVYPYSPDLLHTCTTDNRVTTYKSSDGYLVIKVQLSSSNLNYPSFVINSINTPNGFVSSSDFITTIASSSNI